MAAGSDNQHHSSRTPALGLRFLLLFAISIVALVLDHRGNRLDTVRRTLDAAVYPLRVIVDAPVSLWRWTDSALTDRDDLQRDLVRLRAERLLTNARLQRYSALEAENARLRAMLEATKSVTDQVRVTEIMAVSANPFRHSIVIDKGTREGVYDGQAMINADGIVGQVIDAGLLSAQGLLISDPDHALPVEVNRNGLRTIAVGTGEFDRLELPNLPNNADIEAGDLLVTSGLGGAFPAGYPVGIVTDVTRVPAEPFAVVTADPAASLDQVREIMLVWSYPGEADSADVELPAGDVVEPAADAASSDENAPAAGDNDLPQEEAEDADAPGDAAAPGESVPPEDDGNG